MQSNKIRNLILLVGFLSFIGFLDASYLVIEHYRNGLVPCTIFKGCEQVLSSRYSEIFGIPVALFGMNFYAMIFISAMVYLEHRRYGLLLWLRALTVGGFLASAYFFYLQAFIIKAFCTYCIISATLSVLLLATSFYAVKINKYE
ncbi:MAG: vitamin K epoxide reductase family protein [Candidatus Yanofskybacteria bacterium]|nr:vitamin K epoxide reductase family protein [Candidatus Yanofskybacteria bacterium]